MIEIRVNEMQKMNSSNQQRQIYLSSNDFSFENFFNRVFLLLTDVKTTLRFFRLIWVLWNEILYKTFSSVYSYLRIPWPSNWGLWHLFIKKLMVVHTGNVQKNAKCERKLLHAFRQFFKSSPFMQGMEWNGSAKSPDRRQLLELIYCLGCRPWPSADSCFL